MQDKLICVNTDKKGRKRRNKKKPKNGRVRKKEKNSRMYLLPHAQFEEVLSARAGERDARDVFCGLCVRFRLDAQIDEWFVPDWGFLFLFYNS
jgi:hypothetical protein